MAADRLTPHGLLFADLAERFASLDPDLTDLGAFSRNPDVQRLVGDVESAALIDENPLAAAEYVHLLFAAWQHWRAGLVVVAPERIPTLPSSLAPLLPSSAVYVQLPERAFWMQPQPEGAHEPLDGCYVVPLAREELLVVALTGLHPGRSGVTTVTLTVRATDLVEAADALPADAFAPRMSGGAEAGFRSVATAAELLYLVSVALAVSAA